MNLPFMGETMVCIMSGPRKRSNSEIESGWDCIIADGKRYYVSVEWREKSYKKIGIEATYTKILLKVAELNGGAS